MKKLILIVLLASSLAQGTPAHAQILNPGFEQILPTAPVLSNWTAIVSFPLGCPLADSSWFQTTDAHTGDYALEIRNVDCSPNSIIHADVFATDYGISFGPTIPFFNSNPTDFSFYYKGVGLGGDGLYMNFMVVDANFTAICVADTVLYTPVVSNYTKVTVPVKYMSSQTPNKLIAHFKIVNPLAQLMGGSWFRIDDLVDGGNTTSVKDGLRSGAGISCYPNPATDKLHIKISNSDKVSSLCITDAFGRTVRQLDQSQNSSTGSLDIDVSALSSGVYFANVKAGQTSHRVSFVKQ